MESIAELKEENRKLEVGLGVDLIKFVVDFNFFPDGTKGFIIKNTGEYLGIKVEFTEPKEIQGQSFNFNARDLKENGKTKVILTIQQERDTYKKQLDEIKEIMKKIKTQDEILEMHSTWLGKDFVSAILQIIERSDV
ncbi:MAG: hypothetical protein KAX49_07405 [Halanaerobiales bacterium]|nr:hypothetical protein [Halanaerobiales bacterium]